MECNTSRSDSPAAMVPRATTAMITDVQITSLLHKHPLIPFTRFVYGMCRGCSFSSMDFVCIYGGYRCNELECNGNVVFHKDCGNPAQEINHSSHPQHSLKFITRIFYDVTCSLCAISFKVGYCCSICDFKLDLKCARRPEQPLVLLTNSYGHEHPLQILNYFSLTSDKRQIRRQICVACRLDVMPHASNYKCRQCEFVIHMDCLDFPEAYHTSHPQHPLKSLKSEIPDYADKICLLCAIEFDKGRHQLHHCDVCNFSICRACMRNPPPVSVDCQKTHEHQLHLFPRRLDFTCNACGTHGNRSPYFCLQCNFMIHRQCIGLPRVININRHDHRISYTRRLGHRGKWKCRVCRENVNGFYGAYTCINCPSIVVHSLCATDSRVWDMIEREGTPEEEEIAPFEEIDDTTIKHFSHDHTLQINKDGRILPESTLCVACVFQICSEPFYSCEQCAFVLHEKCAHLPRKKRHVHNNQPFTLQTDAHDKISICDLCFQEFTGFKYKSVYITIDVRCGSTSDSIEHGSHQHPLYYYSACIKCCRQCGTTHTCGFGCSECDYFLDCKCALLQKKVMKKRYDDHPLFLRFGDKDANGKYWCEACEKKMDPKKWFYTCNDCGIALHISCVVGDFAYIMPGSMWGLRAETNSRGEVVANNSICRILCSACNSRCKLPSIRKTVDDEYVCSYKCSSIRWSKRHMY